MQLINSFQGEYRFLSNFWPCLIEWEGRVYATLEHAYVSSKVESPDLKESIRSCPTPGDAKEFLATNGIQPVISWNRETKLGVMERLLFIKFGGRNPLLTRALLLTGSAELIEGNTWNDTFWGVCNEIGENHLGQLLMKVRASLFVEKQKLEELVTRIDSYQVLADAMHISRQTLYEKMISFGISQRKYLGY